MSRAIGSGILINILLVCCRGRFFRTTFGNTHQWWRLLILGCISSGLLASFPVVAEQIGIPVLLYTHLSNLSGWGRGILVFALLCIPTIIYILLGSAPKKETIRIATYFIALCIGMMCSVILSPWLSFTGWLLVAIIEERTKTSTSRALHDRLRFLSSDLIFFGLMSALGFSFVENIIYLRNLGAISIGVANGLVIKRMLTSRVMHLCYTGLITVGTVTIRENKSQWLKGISFFFVGIMLHALFNTTLGTTHTSITLAIILSGYFFMSRLIYKSERVYIS